MAQPTTTDNPIVQSFLQRRGLSVSDLYTIQYPRPEHQHNPYLLQGVSAWIDILHQYKGLPIAVFPDYDMDGIASGTVARVGLYLFGFGDVFVYPPKTKQGYGLTKASVDSILAQRPDIRLLITTDNGSNAHAGIRYAKSLGLTVLVTDHHLAGDAPLADAVVNPNGHGDTTYPYPSISGTAVIYKVLQAYAYRYAVGQAALTHFHSLLLLVGISTISDVMPLLNENRYFVTRAVGMLTTFEAGHSDERIASYQDNPLDQFYRGVDLLLKTLHTHGKLKYGIDADTFGFVIGPMFNSPRRVLGDSALGFALFQTTKDTCFDAEGVSPSDLLYAVNEKRKAIVNGLTSALFTYMDQHTDNLVQHAVFTANMDAGVAGLLAGKFATKYRLPCIAFSAPSSEYQAINGPMPTTGLLSGSARSVGDFNMHAFLSYLDATYPGLIFTFGGHDGAAGIKIEAARYVEFKQCYTAALYAYLTRQAQQAGVVMTQQQQLVDGEFVLATQAMTERILEQQVVATGVMVPVSDTDSILSNAMLLTAVECFASLAPFGNGFDAPTFSVMFEMNKVQVRTMGASDVHVKIMLPNGLAVISWNNAPMFTHDERDGEDRRVFIATGAISENEYNGYVSLQLIADTVELLA